jgi:hypothetical protein
MIRNQAIRAPLIGITTVEVIVAASHLLRDPRNHIETLIGCASPQLRQLGDRLNLPVAYAPDVVDCLREHSASIPAAIWTSKALDREDSGLLPCRYLTLQQAENSLIRWILRLTVPI